MAALCPGFDAERFGVINTGNPKHADIFLVTGSVNEQNKDVVKQIYDQMIEPKVVAACGICACNGGVFKDCYNVSGGVDTVIPVDVYVEGCAVRPESIIDAVVKAIDALDAKSIKLKEQRKNQKKANKNVTQERKVAEQVQETKDIEQTQEKKVTEQMQETKDSEPMQDKAQAPEEEKEAKHD